MTIDTGLAPLAIVVVVVRFSTVRSLFPHSFNTVFFGSYYEQTTAKE
jgi:hypothetical protein